MPDTGLKIPSNFLDYLGRSEFTKAATYQKIMEGTLAERGAVGFRDVSTTGIVGHWRGDAPEYPDDPAGVTYFNDFLAAGVLDSWAGSGLTPTVTGGVLVLTSASTGAEYVRRTASQTASSTVKVRARLVQGSVTSVTLASNLGATAQTFVPTSAWQVFNLTPVTNWTGTLSYVEFTLAGQSANCIIQIDWLYIGTGAYLANSLLDLSGNANHGTIFGCTPVDTPYGRGLSGDGVNDYVLTSITGIPSTISLSLWFKNSKLGTTQRMFFQSGGTGRLLQITTLNNIDFYSRRADGTTTVTARIPAASWTADTWNHLVAIQNGLSVFIYLNGVLVGSETLADIYTTFGTISRVGISDVFFNPGTIAQPRIYNRALSAEEVWSLYQNPLQGADGLVKAISPVPNSQLIRTWEGLIKLGAKTPATAGAAGMVGDMAYDANFIYICTAANTWKRVAIATWP